LKEDAPVELRFSLISSLGVHLAEEACVHANESVQIDRENVSRLDLSQIPFIASIYVRDEPAGAEIPARFRTRLYVDVELFKSRSC